MQFKPFYTPLNHKGNPRKAGFEFELANISPVRCAELITDLFGGTIEHKHSLHINITDTSVGTFTVELDAKMVKNVADTLENTPSPENTLIDTTMLRSNVSQFIGTAAAEIVPLEIVTPPLESEHFEQLEALREALQREHAKGTKARLTNAFGMHINAEIASDDVTYILNMLRAFLVLYPWLIGITKVDMSRRVLNYIDPFGYDYCEHILPATYAPSMDVLIKDYLAYNPTRSRALDLLPLFAYVMPKMLENLKPAQRNMVKPRPTFHYRLPNCDIDNPQWRIAREWRYWCDIETLADDCEKLRAISAQYTTYLKSPKRLLHSNWSDILHQNFGYEAL